MRWSVLLVVALALCVRTVAAAEFEVAGDLPRTGALSQEKLAALGAEEVRFEGHGGAHTMTGVSLWKVLQAFGFTPGPMGKAVPPAEKRAGYRKVIVASAGDGFQAVFSTAELAEALGKTRVYVAYKMDGQPLPGETGPFRLVVPTDGEPSRSLHGLRVLRIVDLRQAPPPPAASRALPPAAGKTR